jgi:diadenylate cyclase
MTVPPEFDQAVCLVQAGTPLREALDAIVAARNGALLTIGDEEAVGAFAEGGFALDAPFTPRALYELCKMDGAVMLDTGLERILRANVHLGPDRHLATDETGIRHRTAQQLSLATRTLVVAVSERRGTITLYLGGARRVVTG